MNKSIRFGAVVSLIWGGALVQGYRVMLGL